MAPFDVTGWGTAAEPLVHVLLGMGFGFVLERAGFGSARKLTNQFYLNDLTVLKVMFTAIITTMVLVSIATTLGWLNYEALWINPTYLGSGIVGGLIFGVGFVVGGYCPGTALVSAATLKLDGLLFVLGVLGGIFVFGYTEPWVDRFWNDSGNYGTLSLFDWMGLPMPAVVLMAVTLALGFFAAGEWVERWMARRAAQEPAASSSDEASATLKTSTRLAEATTVVASRFRPAYVYAAALLVAATSMLALWKPTEGLRTRSAARQVEAAIQAGKLQIDPRELADLMRDKRLALALIDLRDEASFNRFHLLDARRVEVADLNGVAALPARTVKVLLADDETKALDALRSLAARKVENLYVLAGGLPSWTALYAANGQGSQRLAALGADHPLSRPPTNSDTSVASYVARVKRPGLGGKKSGGGCGG